MIQKIKNWLYFPVAYYFAFWARIQLFLWKPRIIVVTGSSGKTTLLHLIESQLGDKARYSHHANSSYGIPFDILGLNRKKLTVDEWIYLFFAAPFKALKKPFKEKLYVVEADCDRPYEGVFLGKLLKPEVTLWLNVSKTHSMNFDNAVRNKKFQTIEEAVAYEFGHILICTSRLAIVNADSDLIVKQLVRTRANKVLVTEKDLVAYKVLLSGTEFQIGEKKYTFNVLLPRNVFYAVEATGALMNFLKEKPTWDLSKLHLPPGRSSLFKGIKNTTLVDSCYNANLDSTTQILQMFEQYPAKGAKWAIVGDMLEQGESEQNEHEKLANVIANMKLSKIILYGPRVKKYTYPKLKHLMKNIPIEVFKYPKEVLEFLQTNIQGDETILFKGARFLEGVIEHLLANKEDVKKLSRREKIWDIRRKQWGL